MNSPNTVNPEYKSSTVDVGELEKLARAATPGPWVHSEQRGLPGHCFVAQVFIGDDDGCSLAKLDATVDPRNASADAAFIAAANPAAILELISEYKNAIRLLSIANNGLSGSHTIAWQAQTKVAIDRSKISGEKA